MTDAALALIARLYDRFNARDIDGALVALTDDVIWANGMEGGHVHGRDAIREYWTRQWSMFSPHVEPVRYERISPDAMRVEVRQTVRDLDGNSLEGQTHGLQDRTVGHVFRFRDGKVARFDID